MRLKKSVLSALLLSVILAFTVFATACDPKVVSSQLTVPANAKTVEDTFVWDMVAGAAKYEVDVDGTKHSVTATSYSLSALTEAKAYTLKVRAIGDGTHYTDSDWTSGVSYTLNAQVTLTFESSGGSSVAPITQRAGSALTLPAPTKADYEFAGWFIGDTAFTAETMPAESATLTAKWIEDWSEVYNFITTDGNRIISGLTTFGKTLTSLTIPEAINGKPVTAIGNDAFKSNISITEIVLGTNVTEIGSNAFNGCTGIESINLASVKALGANAFSSCTSLSEINFGSVETIGGSAFSGCTGLVSVSFSSTVKSIGGSAFYNCTKLAAINISSSVETIESSAFNGCSKLLKVEIPATVKTIGSVAFNNVHYVKLATVEPVSTWSSAFSTSNAKIIEVADSAVNTYKAAWVSYAAKIYSAAGLSNKGEYIADAAEKIFLAYFGTDSSFEIPTGITEVAANAFNSISGLISVTVPATVTAIGASAFYPCYFVTFKGATAPAIANMSMPFVPTTIKAIIVPNASLTAYKTAIDAAYTINGTMHTLDVDAKVASDTSVDSNGFIISGNKIISYMGSATELELDFDGVTEIAAYAFSNFTFITSVTIGDNIETIHPSAFENCSKLATVSLGVGSSLNRIDNSAFRGCAYTSFTVPSSVTFIGSTALSCKIIYFRGNTAPDTTNTFSAPFDTSKLSAVIVPDGKGNDFKTKYSSFSDVAAKVFEAGNVNGDYITNAGELSAYLGAESSITLPDSITAIAAGAFKGNTSLVSISMPKATKIGSDAFSGCTALTTVNIPEVTQIESNAFNNCSKLTTIAFPKLTAFGSYAFSYCTSLMEITIPVTVTTAGSSAFNGWTASQIVKIQFASAADAGWGYWSNGGAPTIQWIGRPAA